MKFLPSSIHLFRIVISEFDIKIHNADSSYSKNKVATALFEKQKLDSVIFDPEILWLAKQQQFKVGEFPVWWSHVENSRIQYDSLKKSLFVFQELFRIKRLHKTNPYPQSIGPDI